jgi:Na+/melibiose symporter-like transporter
MGRYRPWLAVVVAVLGGIALGLGLARLRLGFTMGAAVWAVIGVILLWWAISDSRKAHRGTPESEADGSHTIE